MVSYAVRGAARVPFHAWCGIFRYTLFKETWHVRETTLTWRVLCCIGLAIKRLAFSPKSVSVDVDGMSSIAETCSRVNCVPEHVLS